MMQCVAAEGPQISWRARDVSAAQALPDLELLSTDTAAQLINWANITAAPLLVPCARSPSEDSLLELVRFGICITPQTSSVILVRHVNPDRHRTFDSYQAKEVLEIFSKA